MDNYIIKEYIDSNSERKTKKRTIRNDVDSRRRARVIEIFEQANGFIGPEEIAEALDIDLKKIEGYLGKTRIQMYERLKAGEDIAADDEEETKVKRRRLQVSDTPVEQSKKLTPSRVKKLTNERNQRIIAMHLDGLSIEEIARKEMLTPDQAKEIFLSLGLSLYTREELLEMQKQEAEERKSREDAERLERKRKRQRDWVRKKRARIRAKKQEEKDKQRRADEEEEERKREEETGVVLIRNFEDLKRAMRLLLKQGKSKQAIELGEHFLEEEDILSGEEKAKLFLSIEELKEIKEAYQRRERREKGKTKVQRNGEDEAVEEK